MQVIKDYVKQKKPSLSDSSITTYSSILKNLYKRVFDDSTVDFKKFDVHKWLNLWNFRNQ